MPAPSLETRLLVRERPAGRPALNMRWESLLFLHWAWDPAAIQKTLPAGLQVDLFEGRAWLGVVPFFMRRVHPVGLFPVPWVSDFLELNVRTYVHDDNGLPGVWFYSLVCNQPVAVEIARRFFHLNYVHAAMEASAGLRRVQYGSHRKGGSSASFRYEPCRRGAETVPGTLEFFLVERYLLFSADPAGRLHAGRVHHAPYRVASGPVAEWSFSPAADDGFAAPSHPPEHMIGAESLDVQAWPITRL